VKFTHIVTNKDEQVSEVTRSAKIDKTARIFRHREGLTTAVNKFEKLSTVNIRNTEVKNIRFSKSGNLNSVSY